MGDCAHSRRLQAGSSGAEGFGYDVEGGRVVGAADGIRQAAVAPGDLEEGAAGAVDADELVHELDIDLRVYCGNEGAWSAGDALHALGDLGITSRLLASARGVQRALDDRELGGHGGGSNYRTYTWVFRPTPL